MLRAIPTIERIHQCITRNRGTSSAQSFSYSVSIVFLVVFEMNHKLRNLPAANG